jgi:hypothetical protein
MKAGLWFGIGVVVTILVVLMVFAGGWLLWGRGVWGMPMFAGRGMMDSRGFTDGCGTGLFEGGRRDRGMGMMGRPGSQGRGQSCVPYNNRSELSGTEMDMEAAEEAVQAYLDDIDYEDLEIAELMEFERNFYAIVAEPDTGVGAMEILVDRETGSVGPEPGPNMMWNAKYGMHRGGGMMGNRAADLENDLTEDEVLDIAQRWLDSNRSDVTVEEHADAFYGYYTIHTLKDGEIDGMLSVHGDSGQVWYHTWHGDFVQMVETAEHEHTD